MTNYRERDPEFCTGCQIVQHEVCNLSVHQLYIQSSLRDCPCSICLVKTMCQEKCKARITYFKYVRDRSRQQYRQMGGTS